MYERKRVFILVKTYPTISEKYAELVCTAGVLENGDWVRLYPIPFRLLNDAQKFPKYTWVNVDIERNTSDFRIESYRPDLDSIQVEPALPKIKGRVDWQKRRDIVFNGQQIYTNLRMLIAEAKEEKKSLAIFKPSKIKDLKVEKVSAQWNRDKIESLKRHAAQMNMFRTPEEVEEDFKVVKKVPYCFRYEFEDDEGKTSTLMIEDWEIGMLYWKCLLRHDNDQQAAIADVRKKYFDEYLQRDLYFFMGTSKKFHNVSPNPFMIIGVLPLPKGINNEQISFFRDWTHHIDDEYVNN